MPKKNGVKIEEDMIVVKDSRLIIDVELSDGEPSSSGKTLIYYSTRGNKGINGGFTVSLNLYKYPPRR